MTFFRKCPWDSYFENSSENPDFVFILMKHVLADIAPSKQAKQNSHLQLSKKCFVQFSYHCNLIYSEFNDQKANSVDPDEVAHYEPLHLNLGCLQIQLF